MGELGLSHRLKWIDSNVGYYAKGRLWKFTSPFDLLRFRPLPLLDRIRLGLVTLGLQRRKEWASLEQVTATDWMRRNAGHRVVRRHLRADAARASSGATTTRSRWRGCGTSSRSARRHGARG